MTGQDEITLYPISEARTCLIRGTAGEVVLYIRSGSDERHYQLSVGDLERLARQLSDDARLIKV